MVTYILKLLGRPNGILCSSPPQTLRNASCLDATGEYEDKDSASGNAAPSGLAPLASFQMMLSKQFLRPLSRRKDGGDFIDSDFQDFCCYFLHVPFFVLSNVLKMHAFLIQIGKN